MEEIPSHNMLVQGLKVAILVLDLTLRWARNPFRGKILTVGKLHKKKNGRIIP
jgi:hypothetical protein